MPVLNILLTNGYHPEYLLALYRLVYVISLLKLVIVNPLKFNVPYWYSRHRVIINRRCNVIVNAYVGGLRKCFQIKWPTVTVWLARAHAVSGASILAYQELVW